MRYIIGVDIGTSGTKSILIDEQGAVRASSTVEYPLYTPKPGWSEQEPGDWWDAVKRSLRAVIAQANVSPEEIAGLGLSGQMHGMVALDAGDTVVRRAILWNDQRTGSQCERIEGAVGGPEGLLKLTNNRMLPGYTGGKILWMREEEPENYARTKVILNPKDYIRFLLTGEKATEVSDASGTGLFDVENRRFSPPLLDALELPRDLFPPCLESDEIAGHVTARAAEETGLPAGLPVVGGGGDAVIQTTGMGLVKSGVLGVVIGTSGVVAMGLESYRPSDGRLQLFCNNAPGLWHAMGVTLAAGGSYRWFRDTLCQAQRAQAASSGRDTYDVLGEAAEAVPAGSEGLVFLPYLSGERCPYADPNARGVFFGLSLAHTHAHMTRAVMEGVTYSLRQAAGLIFDMDKSIVPEKLIASGGGAASPLWRQILADVFDLPVVTVSGSAEGGAYGAALVAGVGCGVYSDLKEAIAVLREETLTLPNPETVAQYRKPYAVYSGLYAALKPSFDA